MKKAYKYFITAVLSIATLSGCINDENEPEVAGSSICPAFTATIGSVGSRAYDQAWEQGDEIGISGCRRTNVCHVTAAGDGNFAAKNSNEQIYFQEEAEAVFTAYYPWSELTGGAMSVKADTRDQSRQKSFDFLWSQATGSKEDPNVSFTFAHKMAKVVLTVKPGIGMSYDELKATDLSFDGLRHTGTFNIADGSIALDNTGGAWKFSGFASFNDAEKTITSTLILLPQVFDKPLDFMAVLDLPDNKNNLKAGIDFTGANREKDGAGAKNEWVAGRQYNLSVTLRKTEISLDECVINQWNVVDGEEIIID